MENIIILIVGLLAMFIGLAILSLAVWRQLDEQTRNARNSIPSYRAQRETMKELEKQGFKNWKDHD